MNKNVHYIRAVMVLLFHFRFGFGRFFFTENRGFGFYMKYG